MLALPVGIIAACDASVLLGPYLNEWAAEVTDYSGAWNLSLVGLALLFTISCSYFAYRAPNLDAMYRRLGYLLIAAGVSWTITVLIAIDSYDRFFSHWIVFVNYFAPLLFMTLGPMVGGLYLVYFRGQERQSLRHQLFRYSAGVLFSLPVGVVLGIDLAVVFGEKNLPYADQIIWGSIFIFWAGMAYLSLKSPSLGGIFRRNARGFSIAAFLLPVATGVMWITEASAPDPIIHPAVYFVVALVVGCVLGIPFWFLSRLRFDDKGEGAAPSAIVQSSTTETS